MKHDSDLRSLKDEQEDDLKGGRNKLTSLWVLILTWELQVL